MRIRILPAFAIGASLAAGGCSPPNRLFDDVPFPAIRSMTCTVKAVHNGVLNPTYYGDRASDSMKLIFSDLNPTARTARLKGNQDSAAVEYRAGPDQMQFIETTPMGSLTVTTVFAPPEPGMPMPAVHSRHILVSPANVSISQSAGECHPN